MITSLASYLTAIEQLALQHSDLTATTLPWFRGQADATWKLVPSIYRGDWDVVREREMHRDFRLRALMEVEQKPTTYVGWLFVMQHHGIPTRLLDWSESALVALYFAVEDFRKHAAAAVWVMHPWHLNELPQSYGQQTVPQLLDDIDKAYAYPSATVPGPNVRTRVEKDLPMAIRPAHTTRRIVAQRGQFTIHGHKRDGLEDISATTPSLALKKLEIDGSSKLRILQDLYKAGIARFTLFPDLDGLSTEIRIRYSKAFMR